MGCYILLGNGVALLGPGDVRRVEDAREMGLAVFGGRESGGEGEGGIWRWWRG